MLAGGSGLDTPAEGASGHRIEDAVESTAAKFVSRYVVPALIGIVAFFLIQVLNRQERQGDDIVEIKRKQDVTNTLLAERVIRQVDINSARLDKHEDLIGDLKSRVSALEHSK